MSNPLTGGCLCGAIRYAVSQPVTELRACHCRHCQKASGAGGGVNAVVPAASFRITQGTPKLYVDTAASGNRLNRHFCGACGSPIYSQREKHPEFVVIRGGSFDDSDNMRITAHIWTASARPWSHIDPNCEQHPGNLPPKV
jgi:hypothetical protein